MFYYTVVVQENHLDIILKDGKFLGINLYEIRLEGNIIHNDTILNALFFDCQCALFLADMNNHESFTPIKNIFAGIDNDKFPNLSKIIVENKSDLKSEKPNEELQKFINGNPNVGYIEISLKNGDNVDNLLNKIYDAVNSPKNVLIPINKVAKGTSNKYSIDNCEKPFSLILVGNTAVGKTNLMARYARNGFQSLFLSTNGYNQEIKILKINNRFYHLTLWDTAGQERYSSLPRKYYKNVDGVLLLFDLTEKESFEQTSKWIEDINQYSTRSDEEENEKKDNGPIIYLIGNKLDLLANGEEIITQEEKEALSKKLGVKYYEVSAKWNLNIEEVIARIILEIVNLNRNSRRKTFIVKKNQEPVKKKGCCLSKENKK